MLGAFAKRLLFLVVIIVAAAGPNLATRWWSYVLQPVNAADTQSLRIQVPQGASTADVAQELAAQGLIRYPLAFRYYARRQNIDSQLKPGTYEFTRAMTVPQILQKLAGGQRLVHRVVVPEGVTAAEVADIVARQGVATAADFLAAVRSGDLVQDLAPPGTAYPLEGYLFPATYEFEPGTSAAAVARAMVTRFRAAYGAPLQKRAVELGLSTHQVVTLASIVEAEATLAAERAVIAGVYHNRLRIGMRLEADPTVRYAVKKPRGVALTAADLAVENAYNTYRRTDLPPGPIGNPGEAALRSTLWPAEHEYIFFVAKGNGSGAHRFSETLAEHEDNIAQAEQERTASGR